MLGVEVRFHPDVQEELAELPPHERRALLNAVEKLGAVGVQLGYPHTSAVKGMPTRELRPRAGRSPWRAFYARVGDRLWILAIGSEAEQDPKGFHRAVGLAQQRLEEVHTDPP